MSAEKTIRVSEDHRKTLHDLKDVGESYDDVIGDLIEAYQEQNRRELADRMRETEAMDANDLVPLDSGDDE